MLHSTTFRYFPILAFFLLASPASSQEMKVISFDVVLPAEATLEIDGYKTVSTGPTRTYETPAVAVGRNYVYTIKAVVGDRHIVKTIVLKTEGALVFDLRPDFADKPTKPADKPLKDNLTEAPTKAGFVAYYEKDGETTRLWVFRAGSKDLEAFKKDGELAKHVVLPGIGPKRMTVKAPDKESAMDYLLAQDGFATVLTKEDHVWVFKAGSKELQAFKKDGELAKHVTRIFAGPMGKTIKAPDGETIDAYMKGFKAD